jgi:hypothetical protein
MTDPNPGGQKTYGSYGSGYTTLDPARVETKMSFHLCDISSILAKNFAHVQDVNRRFGKKKRFSRLKESLQLSRGAYSTEKLNVPYFFSFHSDVFLDLNDQDLNLHSPHGSRLGSTYPLQSQIRIHSSAQSYI